MDINRTWLTPDILESIQDGYVFLDRELSYVYVNAAAEALIMRNREDLIGRYIWDVFPDSPDEIREAINRASETRKATHVSAFNMRRDAWYEVQSYPSEAGLSILFRDVTTEQRHRVMLEESESRFRVMADAAPVMIWMSGADGKCFYFNKRWLDFRGRAMEEELGDGWKDGIHPEDLERFLDTRLGAFERQEPFIIEYRLRRHDDVYRWLLDRGEPRFDSEKQFSGFIGSCIDIHERRHTEEQMSFLADASTLLASSLDYEQTINQVANLLVPHLADWCGVHLYDEQGELKPLAVAHVDPSKVAMARELSERYPSDPDRPYTLANVARTGNPALISELTDEMLLAAAQDEQQLEIIRSLGIKSAVTVPLVAWGEKFGAIIMVWAESGQTYDEADLRFAQEIASRAAASIKNARLYREARMAEASLRSLNETLEERVQERTAELQHEVQERARAEEALGHLVKQFEEKNQELQNFAYVASHDLQEPLRKIQSFAERLASKYDAQLDDQGRHYLDRMNDASARMTRLITDLLEFSRLMMVETQFEKVDLSAVIEDVVVDLQFRIEETRGTVEMSGLPTIEADPTQMHQLFQNLIGNGLKYHREGVTPHVQIKGAIVPNTGPGSHSMCRVEVKDNGIGFEEQYAEDIFAPFKRLHSRDKFGGTGIGLAICRRIAERHGGTVKATSTPGEGSVFVVHLPIRQKSRNRLARTGTNAGG